MRKSGMLIYIRLIFTRGEQLMTQYISEVCEECGRGSDAPHKDECPYKKASIMNCPGCQQKTVEHSTSKTFLCSTCNKEFKRLEGTTFNGVSTFLLDHPIEGRIPVVYNNEPE